MKSLILCFSFLALLNSWVSAALFYYADYRWALFHFVECTYFVWLVKELLCKAVEDKSE